MYIQQPIDLAGDTTGVHVDPIARLSGLGEAGFSEYRDRRQPVILTDAARDWPINRQGTPAYFRKNYGGHNVRVWGADYPLAAVLDLLETSTADKPGPYPCKFEIAKDFPEMLADVSPRFGYSLPDRQSNAFVPQRLFRHVNNLEIFFGGPGGQFPYLHYDILRLHAWITQLHGDKEFTVYAPGDGRWLYVDPETPWQSSIRNHHNPDFERYPLFRNARPQKVVLHAGETLFLPCGWWHTARSLNMTISVAFDQLGADNWADFAGDAVAEQRRLGRRGRAQLLQWYLQLIDPLLGLSERLGTNRHRDWGSR